MLKIQRHLCIPVDGIHNLSIQKCHMKRSLQNNITFTARNMLTICNRSPLPYLYSPSISARSAKVVWAACLCKWFWQYWSLQAEPKNNFKYYQLFPHKLPFLSSVHLLLIWSHNLVTPCFGVGLKINLNDRHSPNPRVLPGIIHQNHHTPYSSYN